MTEQDVARTRAGCGSCQGRIWLMKRQDVAHARAGFAHYKARAVVQLQGLLCVTVFVYLRIIVTSLDGTS